jgi:hypothetical protein
LEIALSRLVGADSLLQAVVPGDEKLLDPCSGVVDVRQFGHLAVDRARFKQLILLFPSKRLDFLSTFETV